MSSQLYNTCAKYSEVSTVHGVNYIFEKVDTLNLAVVDMPHTSSVI